MPVPTGEADYRLGLRHRRQQRGDLSPVIKQSQNRTGIGLKRPEQAQAVGPVLGQGALVGADYHPVPLLQPDGGDYTAAPVLLPLILEIMVVEIDRDRKSVV